MSEFMKYGVVAFVLATGFMLIALITEPAPLTPITGSDDMAGTTTATVEEAPLLAHESNTQAVSPAPIKAGDDVPVNSAPKSEPKPKPAPAPVIVSPTTLPTVPPPLPSPPPQSPAPLPPSPMITEAVNVIGRAATVNILCSHNVPGSTYYDSGSGVVIDPRGVILTNAHVAQHFLLDTSTGAHEHTCVIRTGSPARHTYTARLLYLPSAWIERNKKNITLDEFTNAGEDDYAFLLIDGMTDPSRVLPDSFSSVQVSADNEGFDVGDQVLVTAYPGEFLSLETLLSQFYLTSTIATVEKFYGFDGITADSAGLGGIIVAQKGSSGGGVITPDLTLHALVEGTVLAETTAERNAFVILTSYIERSLRKLTGGGIADILADDLVQKASQFGASTVPLLRALLLDELNK